MRRFAVTILAVALMAGAQTKDDAEKSLKAAKNAELVDGDLNAALKQYRAIVTKYRQDRAVVAKALVLMAECHQKMGDAEAQKLFQQVVRDYSDQKESVAIAQARLNGKSSNGGEVVVRPVKVGRHFTSEAAVSPDGRYIAFINWDANGNVAIHDLTSGEERDLIHEASNKAYAELPVFTHDSKKIVYTWSDDSVKRTDLRMIGINDSTWRTILRGDNYKWVEAADSSPDGKSIAVLLRPKDDTRQLGLLSPENGSVRVLRTVPGSQRLNPGGFSPDGKWLAFDEGASNQSARDLYSIAMDTGNLVKLADSVEKPSLPLFTPDGTRVVFLADRAGHRHLWGIRMNGGRAIGEPEIVRRDAGTHPLGLTANGSFVVYDRNTIRHGAIVAELDPVSWKVKTPPKEASNLLRDTMVADPVWSPDGKLLAYTPVSTDEQQRTKSKVTVKNWETGETHEVLGSGLRLRGWFPDSKTLLINGEKGYLVDVSTGQDRVGLDRRQGLTIGSMDGRSIFSFGRSSGARQAGKPVPETDTVQINRHDVTSGENIELCHLTARQGAVYELKPSPDGASLALTVPLPSRDDVSLMVMSASGGPPREISLPKDAKLFSGIAWTGDSKSVLFVRRKETSKHLEELWAQPVNGGEAVATGLEFLSIRALAAHPNGRVAFVGTVSEAGDNLSVIEHLFAERRNGK